MSEIITKTSINQGEINYTIIESLSGDKQGRNSFVSLVKDLHLDATFILKEINVNNNNLDKFKESRLLYKYRHPNVAAIQYACVLECDDEKQISKIGLFSPYYKNGTLKDKLSCFESPLTIKEILRYSFYILRGLHHIHKDGLLHQDLKPDNIMISDTDEAMIADFGLASYYEKGFTGDMAFYLPHWTPDYILNLKPNIRTDIYQFGLLLFRAVNGINVLAEELFSSYLTPEKVLDQYKLAVAITKGKFPTKEYKPHVPLALKKIINKCLEVNPGNRYNNTLELTNALANIDDSISLYWKNLPSSAAESVWVCEYKGKIYTVCHVVNKDGTHNLEVKKRVNQEQRVPKYCYNSMSLNELNKQLKNVLKNL